MQRINLILIIILITFSSTFAQNKKIAYCSNQGTSEFLQVFTMNDDGTNKKQLTNLEENCMRPKFSPDGKQIVFYSDKGFVYLIRDVDNPDLNRTFLVWDGMYPTFMPDGNEIMFNSEDDDDVLSIYVIDTAEIGAKPQIVTDGSYANQQILSSDGKTLAYSSFAGGTKAIMVANLEDESDNYISQASVNNDANLEPDFSSEGNMLVYASFDSNLNGTIRILIDGNESAISKGITSANVPRFSPDGKTIAFAVITGSNVDLYTMSPDGSNRRNLNISGGDLGTFQWVNNDTIVYDAGSDTRLSVGLVDVGSGSSEILAEGGFNLHPSTVK